MYLQKFRLSAVVAAIALAACATAAADPVSLNASIASGSYLNNGTYNGAFTGGSALQAPFQINSASFSFSFSDDADALALESSVLTSTTQTGLVYTGVTYGYYNTSNWVNTIRDYYQVSQGEAGESAGVALGSAKLDSGSGVTSVTTVNGSSSQYVGRQQTSHNMYGGYYSCGNYTCGYAPYYEDTYNDFFKETQSTARYQNGSFIVSGIITDAGLLNELMATRELGFSLNVGGDLYLNAAQLDLDITTVPEPGSLMLMLGALGGIGFAARRRRK
jgi:hypothetical protein